MRFTEFSELEKLITTKYSKISKGHNILCGISRPLGNPNSFFIYIVGLRDDGVYAEVASCNVKGDFLDSGINLDQMSDQILIDLIFSS
jgi:hypothetical protein